VSSRRLAQLLVALVVASTVVAVAGPASRAALTRTGDVAVAPHNNVAAIYNEFGLRPEDTKTLDTVASDLESEGYKVIRYTDVTEGAGSRGGATLANFVGMAKKASVIVINGHGYDPAAKLQDCIGGKGFVGYLEPVLPTAPTNTNTQVCNELDQPILQVEWYPTIEAGKAARRQYVAQGYKNEWFAGPVTIGTNVAPRQGDEVAVDENNFPAPERGGQRPALFLTASGIAHFFGKAKLDIVDVMACQTMALAPAFNSRTYYGHERTACTNKEAVDEVKLFDRLTGHAGVEARSTTKAFALGGFEDQYFKMAETSKPVVLSPAIVAAAPSDGSGVDATTTPVTLQFDAKMADAPPESVVTASGCDATIAGAKWANDDRFSFDLKVPKHQPGKTLTLTVHQSAAKSAGGYPHALDGNQDPGGAGESGVAPNGDDYVLHLSCVPASTFKMVYSGTYDYSYSQTVPQLPPTNETGSYKWTQTQIVSLTAAGPYTSETLSTTTLDASGSSKLDGNALHVTCTIQTPQGYQWVSKRTGGKLADTSPVSFSWGIDSPPLPGSSGATGSAGNGAASGCQSDLTGFIPTFGLPEPTAHGLQTALDSSQIQTFTDGETGSVSFPRNTLPQTKHFDVDGARTLTEGTATNTAKLSFHGTLTITKVS